LRCCLWLPLMISITLCSPLTLCLLHLPVLLLLVMNVCVMSMQRCGALVVGLFRLLVTTLVLTLRYDRCYCWALLLLRYVRWLLRVRWLLLICYCWYVVIALFALIPLLFERMPACGCVGGWRVCAVVIDWVITVAVLTDIVLYLYCILIYYLLYCYWWYVVDLLWLRLLLLLYVCCVWHWLLIGTLLLLLVAIDPLLLALIVVDCCLGV